MVPYLVNNVRPGDIILFHDSGGVFKPEGGDRHQTVQTIPRLIHELRKKGYTFVTITNFWKTAAMAGKHLRHILILFVLSYFFLIFGNGLMSLTNPDEVFYAQTAKEMSQHRSWLTPYLFGAPQFEKPVLLYWLVRVGSALFENPNFAARFFPALFGCLGVIAVYLLALHGISR